MQKPAVLLVIEREDAMHRGVSRALMLARYLHARLDIMFCDIGGPSLRPPATAMSAASKDAREYLHSLRNYIIAPDLEITTEAAFEGSVPEHVLRKMNSAPSTLVIKSVGSEPDGIDFRPYWELIRSCPVPVLLTHAEPWHPVARFAAAVAVTNRQSPELPLAVAKSAGFLRTACDGELDLVYVEGPGQLPANPEALLRLQALSREVQVKSANIRTLTGDFAQALPRFAVQQAYDLIAVGAACTADAPERGLLEHLLRLTTCDLLFVKSHSAAGMLDPRLPLIGAHPHAQTRKP